MFSDFTTKSGILCRVVKKVKERIAVNGTPSQSYGTSLAIWITQCHLPPDTSERAPP